MKIALVIHELAAGGAERTLTTLANAWAGRGNTVTLLSFDDGSAPPAFALDPRINRQALAMAAPSRNLARAILSNGRRVMRLRAALRQENPDVAISFITATNIVTLLAAAGMRTPVIVSERVDISAHRLAGIWRLLRRVTYRSADAVVVQGAQIVSALPAPIRRLARIIPNPVTRPESARVAAALTAPAPTGRKTIVGLGRLAPQKGFDILIRAFAAVAEQFPDWDLVIWGEGEQRAALEEIIEEAGLATRIALPGFTAQPAEVFASADLFVLSSRYEGFPNALAEAMACGVAAIATDCPSGPADIVRDGVDGLLVRPEDSAALAEAISRLAGDAPLRCSLAQRASEITARYGIDDIIQRWDELIDEVRHRA